MTLTDAAKDFRDQLANGTATIASGEDRADGRRHDRQGGLCAVQVHDGQGASQKEVLQGAMQEGLQGMQFKGGKITFGGDKGKNAAVITIEMSAELRKYLTATVGSQWWSPVPWQQPALGRPLMAHASQATSGGASTRRPSHGTTRSTWPAPRRWVAGRAGPRATLGDITVTGQFGQDHVGRRESWQLANAFHRRIQSMVDAQTLPAKTIRMGNNNSRSRNKFTTPPPLTYPSGSPTWTGNTTGASGS
jgi:hypothetical protein